MKWIFIGLALLVVLFLVYIKYSLSQNVNSLNPEAFRQKMANSQILDVRTSREVANGKIKGAVVANIMSGDFKDRVAKLNKEEPVLVYCQSGVRSAKAANDLQHMGFTEVYDLKGGMSAWRAAGLPVE
ncbi:MAG: rhodanese-like domain-containing protein [Bacteroidota bacterium]